MSSPVGGGRTTKTDGNPMRSAHAAPRCTAKSKRTGQQCKAPAVRGWTACRMHGAGGGAPRGKRHGNYRHGGRTKVMAEVRALAALLNREARKVAESI